MSTNTQISLFQEHNGVVEIKKHSALVAMNNIMSLQQRKATNALLKIAKDQLKREPNRRLFCTDTSILKRLAGIGRNENKELKQGLKNLVSLVIEYNILGKVKRERWAFPFLAYVKIEESGKGTVSKVWFELPTPILEAVKNPAMYVKLDLFILRGLNSKHSMALYETLMDYQNLNSISFDIEVLRRLMGVKEGQYKVFTMFKKRVLDVAVDRINQKTDLYVEYWIERQGRKVSKSIMVAVLFKSRNCYKNTM